MMEKFRREGFGSSVWVSAVWAGLIALAAQTGFAQQAETNAATGPITAADGEPKANVEDQPRYLRVAEEKGQTIALEIAARDFTRPDGTGPKIGLIGVAHLGDRSFYQAVQNLLTEYEVVLYESVKPSGAGRARGNTDQERIESTKAAMQFIGGLIETYHAKRQSYPADFKVLAEFAAAEDARLGQFVSAAMIDAWGRQLVYQLRSDQATNELQESTPGYSLMSLGADGKIGGEGIEGDLSLADQKPPDPLALAKDDGLQSQLADALGLKFQLDALSYDKPNWRCSDMAMDELNHRLEAKGLDFGIIGGTLAGSSLPAKLIKVLLGVVKMADAFFEGAIADTLKVVMIEVLSDEQIIQQSLDQFGLGFNEVIVNDRNQVAIDDLKALIEQEPQIKSVAVLYGAAHMPDMAQRLGEQLGYKPAGERWLTAITVDLKQSAVSSAEIDQIRTMIKQMMRQQLRLR